jgi:hypothetical protein
MAKRLFGFLRPPGFAFGYAVTIPPTAIRHPLVTRMALGSISVP